MQISRKGLIKDILLLLLLLLTSVICVYYKLIVGSIRLCLLQVNSKLTSNIHSLITIQVKRSSPVIHHNN